VSLWNGKGENIGRHPVIKLLSPVENSNMVLVAVAGGTSPGLGHSIVRSLQEHPDHTPIVLSRQSSKTPEWIENMGVEVRKVDYHCQQSLVNALEGVHTVSHNAILSLCSLFVMNGSRSEGLV
jgi:hypothetical protein